MKILELKDKSKAFYQIVGTDLWVYYKGQTYYLSQKAQRQQRRGGDALLTSREIIAPMPGKVIKVNVKANDQVNLNQTLIVMEAMKMEYSLNIQSSGAVAEVLCQVGDQVSLGQVLLRLTNED